MTAKRKYFGPADREEKQKDGKEKRRRGTRAGREQSEQEEGLISSSVHSIQLSMKLQYI